MLIETACLPNHLQCFRLLQWEYFENHAADDWFRLLER